MVVANNGWVQNATFPENESKLNNNNNNSSNNNNESNNSSSSSSSNSNNNNNNKSKMSAKGILICRDNSHKFQDRTLNLEQPVKVGRSVARTRAATDNAIFDCKVLSRNHALLWYNAGKFYLQDTGSSNGTFINNQRLSATGAESPAKEVSSGDIVQFGVDVIESTKKITHGCIIATLKLYLPDGKEAKASKSMYMISPVGDVTLEDLYKLNQYIQDASSRELVLHSKLSYLQKLVDNTRKSANLSWKALIDEDRLLSRVKTVESQLIVYSNNYNEDKLRNELIKLEEEKSQYQIAAKKALEKVHQEKIDIKQKLIQLESRLNETEEECSRLHDISNYSQIELLELTVKYSNAQQNILQLESKLKGQESNNSVELSKQQSDEKNDLINKSKQLYKIQNFLQSKLNDHLNDSINIYKKIILLKNYFEKLLNINVKLLTDEFHDDNNINPMENINSIIELLNQMISSIDTMDNDIKNLSSDIIIDENISGKDDIEVNIASGGGGGGGEGENDNNDNDNDDDKEDDSNKINKSNKNDFTNYNKQFDDYILPPDNSRKTLINGKSMNQFIDSNLDDSNDDTSSITSDDSRTVLHFNNDDKSDKLLLLNKSIEHSNDYIIDKSSSEIISEKESHLDIDNQILLSYNDNSSNKIIDDVDGDDDDDDDDDDDEDEDDVNEANNSVINVIHPIYSNKQMNGPKNNDNGGEKELSEEKNDKKEETSREEIYHSHFDNKEEIDMKEKEIQVEKEIQDNERIEEIDNLKTLKPFGKSNDYSSPNSHSRDYIIQIFISSLESLKDDDNDIDGKQLIKKELEDMRDWLIKQSNDIIINKLTEIYYRSKNDKSRMLELNEELAILKEKYHNCYDSNIELTNELRNFKNQCNDLFNCNYNVPIQYFVPVAIALLWMIFEKIF